MSQDVIDAIEFDPFAELGPSSGAGGTGQDGAGERAPSARGDARPRNQETGRFLSTGQRADANGQAAIQRQTPAAPTVGRDVSPDGTPGVTQPREAPRVPTAPGARPGEAEPRNTVAELMERVQGTGFFPNIAAPAPGAGYQQQQEPPATMRTGGYDYTQPYSPQQINLPGELLEAIFHEDRGIAAQGMSVLVNTMYNSLAQDIHSRIAYALATIPQHFDQQTELKLAQKALKDKFYGKFKELNTPVGQQTVYTLAANVAQMYQNMGQPIDPMSDDFVEYVGNQALQMLGLVRQAPRKQFQPGGGNRPAKGSNDPFMEAIGLA